MEALKEGKCLKNRPYQGGSSANRQQPFVGRWPVFSAVLILLQTSTLILLEEGEMLSSWSICLCCLAAY